MKVQFRSKGISNRQPLLYSDRENEAKQRAYTILEFGMISNTVLSTHANAKAKIAFSFATVETIIREENEKLIQDGL
jgi:hypothetical protein